MKILGNLGNFAFLIKSLNALKPYAPELDKLKFSPDFEREKALVSEVEELWANSIIEKYNIKINMINPENIPEEGPVVFVSNHQGYADILPFLSLIKRPLGFIVKSEFSKVPLFNKWVERVRSIFIDRGNVRKSLESINQGVQNLKDGFSMVIFPEGTRSHSSKMANFKSGALKLATKSGYPVVPVTINGSYHIFEETGKIENNQEFDVIIHPVINTAELPRADLAVLGSKVEIIIRSGLTRDLKK